jgi:tetratricopeptide (TPR) repeat protein
MFDVPALEKKWFRYRLKKLLPLLATVLILLISAGAASYLLIVKPGLINDIIKTNPVLVEKTQSDVDTNISAAISPVIQITEKDEQNILKPSLSFMYNIEDQIINYNNTKVLESISKIETTEETAKVKNTESSSRPAAKTAVQSRQVSKPADQPKKIDRHAVAEVKKQPVKKTIVKAAEPVKIAVSDHTAEDTPKEPLVQITHDQISDDELNSVINRFEKLRNPALSLFIAKKYYAQGNYHEAYNYALETNRLNPEIEESILIFSRSLVKLGKKEEAITTLKAYLNKANSTEASVLLDKIEKGTFK